ncbi:MAG: class I SAM-dependent methyltransferase [Methylococcaceae bacterium]|nr:class I SAM-dependent methyltransferase [Methylococcaceae bacterium]
MKRKFLFSFFETPQGKLLLQQEKKYLIHSISVGCKQTILQLGGLGWEKDFIDCTLYKNYSILDAKGKGCEEAQKIRANSFRLPIQSESVDLVLVPHLIEFDVNRFQTMREIERILKPGGDVIIISLNPWNIWVRLQSIWNKKMSDSWRSYLVSRSRIADWLKLLNFEIKITSEFSIDTIVNTPERFNMGRMTFFSMAYAVKAVKRQYTLIPLTPVKAESSRLVSAIAGLKSTTHRNNEK